MEIILLIASFLLNIFSFFYIRWLLKSLQSINEEMVGLYSTIKEYSNHLNSVHELEMFYGDETLKSLMDHTRDLSSSIESLDLILNEDEGLGDEQVEA
tara:strand:- start:344 stop:637 length:294 start_codon:yes stop_codon:yes gene_type:complete